MFANQLISQMLPAIEAELKTCVAIAARPDLDELGYMLAYHLGWEGEGTGPGARGKRIRPILTLLTCAAAGKDWQVALPAAAAVELVHNFSLIHDDIQDNSDLRHGRPTLWKRWGVPQAINAGDAMFTLAHLALLSLTETVTSQVAVEANRLLQTTCLQLTQGQYLDLSYETRIDLTLEAYWQMIGGKTAALLAACTQLGALAAQAAPGVCSSYRQFGWSLGLAFQAQDDLLGIWGNASLTGKSAESDLVTGKKSLPILFGLGRQGTFARRWASGPITRGEVEEMARLLESEGAYAYTQDHVNYQTQQALQALGRANPQGPARDALFELANFLLNRQQ